MSAYPFGSLVRVTTAVTGVDGRPTDTTNLELVVTNPLGVPSTYSNPTHDGPTNSGLYHQDVSGNVIGRYMYDWLADGTVIAAASGTFTVVGNTGELTGTDGPNVAWCTAQDVVDRAAADAVAVDPAIAGDTIQVASHLLYALSGRQYTGSARAVLRPAGRPRGWSMSTWASYYLSMTGSGWQNSWGLADGTVFSGVPQIDLGVYPISAINSVTIDGVTIPVDEYSVYERRVLMRMRPTSASVPTQRYGWPTWQDITLPAGQPGTFAVDVSWGMPPPASGWNAAVVFATEMAKARTPGAKSQLPQRITNVTRQGVSMAVRDPMDYLRNGLTGLYEVDLFINTVNPQRQRRRPRVYSPDLDTVRHPTG